jgi:hypothetical protein
VCAGSLSVTAPDYNIHRARVSVQVVVPSQAFCGLHPLGYRFVHVIYGNRRISNMV